MESLQSTSQVLGRFPAVWSCDCPQPLVELQFNKTTINGATETKCPSLLECFAICSSFADVPSRCCPRYHRRLRSSLGCTVLHSTLAEFACNTPRPRQAPETPVTNRNSSFARAKDLLNFEDNSRYECHLTNSHSWPAVPPIPNHSSDDAMRCQSATDYQNWLLTPRLYPIAPRLSGHFLLLALICDAEPIYTCNRMRSHDFHPNGAILAMLKLLDNASVGAPSRPDVGKCEKTQDEARANTVPKQALVPSAQSQKCPSFSHGLIVL